MGCFAVVPAVATAQSQVTVTIDTNDGDVFYNRQQTPDGSWSGWTDMGARSNGMTHLQAAANADGSLSVFGIGPNGDLWYASESAPEVGWSNWTDMISEEMV